VATTLRIRDPQWLIDLINFESGFNPKIKNPFSSARGLIQFMDATARGMGYVDSLDLVTTHPTIADQMEGPVTAYLKPYAPFNDEYQLYMAVFFPAARKYSANTPFSEIYNKLYGASGPDKYEKFKAGNPGILTPQDYVNYVKKKPIIRVAVKTGGAALLLLIAYLLYRRFR